MADALMRGVLSPTRMTSAWCQTLNHTSSTHTSPISENAISCEIKAEEHVSISSQRSAKGVGRRTTVFAIKRSHLNRFQSSFGRFCLPDPSSGPSSGILLSCCDTQTTPYNQTQSRSKEGEVSQGGRGVQLGRPLLREGGPFGDQDGMDVPFQRLLFLLLLSLSGEPIDPACVGLRTL